MLASIDKHICTLRGTTTAEATAFVGNGFYETDSDDLLMIHMDAITPSSHSSAITRGLHWDTASSLLK
jgi:hypothetical protein